MNAQQAFNLDIEELLQLNASVFWKDTEFRYYDCNQVMRQLFQIDSKLDITGKTDRDLQLKFADEYINNDEQAMRASYPIVSVESTINPNNKQLQHGVSIKSPLYNKENSIAGVIGIHFSESTPAQVIDKVIHKLFQSIPDNRHKPPMHRLSAREQECLNLLVNEDMTAQEIANQLSLSRRTVESYLDHVKYKLGCRNKYELIKVAIKSGLV